MPGGGEFQTNELTIDFKTVADSNSIGTGYLISFTCNGTGSNLTINNLDILIEYAEKL